MHCASCVSAVEKSLQKVAGVEEASVNLATETATVAFDERATGEDLKTAVENAGYKLLREESSSGPSQAESHQQRSQNKLDKARSNMRWAWALTIPIVLWMIPHMFWDYAFLGMTGMEIGMILLSGVVIFVPGWETIRSAWKSAKNGTPNMDVLIAMGALAALSTGVVALLHQLGMAPPFYSFAGIAGMIMAFHLTGRYIETKAKGRASDAIQKLLTLEAKKPS